MLLAIIIAPRKAKELNNGSFALRKAPRIIGATMPPILCQAVAKRAFEMSMVKNCGGAPRASSRKVQSLQANTGFYGTELHPTSSNDRAVVQPVSCPIGCVMIQSLPARARRLYAQFLRELPKAMRQRSIKDYH